MSVHVNDFREDLEPTLAQWRAIARGFCELAGEKPPEHRAAALELILRLEAEPAEGAAAAPVAARPERWVADSGDPRPVAVDADRQVAPVLAERAGPAPFRTGRGGGLDQRDTRSRTGGRP